MTKHKNIYHGNYGGKGNRGGEPIDHLDRVFQKHDTGYHHTKPNSKARIKHDHSLIKAADALAKDKTHGLKLRVKAKVASTYFKMKLKRA